MILCNVKGSLQHATSFLAALRSVCVWTRCFGFVVQPGCFKQRNATCRAPNGTEMQLAGEHSGAFVKLQNSVKNKPIPGVKNTPSLLSNLQSKHFHAGLRRNIAWRSRSQAGSEEEKCLKEASTNRGSLLWTTVITKDMPGLRHLCAIANSWA